MNKEASRNVISYRVREFDYDNYVVEIYSMRLTDELDFYDNLNINYHIWYRSCLKSKKRFWDDIQIKSRFLDYPYQNVGSIDDLNYFLATHYFTYRNPDIDISDILRLNKLAFKYMVDYNNSVLSETDTFSVDLRRKIGKARSNLCDKIIRIECMNVGQANFSAGYCENSEHPHDVPRAIFDIGIRSCSPANRVYAINKLKQIDENGIVVISHYDHDHINGVRYLNKCATDRIWILPEKRLSPTPTERNLISFLNTKNCIFLKDIDYSATSFSPTSHVLEISNLSIYQGNFKKTDPNQSTDENARSLICLIKNNSSILLPGDSLYKEFPTSFDVDYMMIPHHGCNYSASITNIDTHRLKKVIVPAGPHCRYKHPNLTHINQLTHPGCNEIYLMNHDRYFFHDRVQIFAPGIKIADLCCKIKL